MTLAPSTTRDPRLTPARDDIAAAFLRGEVEAGTFVEPVRRQVIAPSVPLRKAPDAGRGLETELIHGEAFDVYAEADGWVWGQALRDSYVGYAPAEAFGPAGPPATHRVAALRSFLYPGPGIKVTPLGFLPYGAHVAVEGVDGKFSKTPAGFLFTEHLAPLGHIAADPVAEAERFLGLPYLWGGKTSLGLDCSGLVQTACHAAGIASPRDSDMQEAALGTLLDLPNDPAHFQRGDLLFWRGHVAMARGDGTMIHATAWSMSVIIEPIAGAIERIEAQGEPLRTARRLPKL